MNFMELTVFKTGDYVKFTVKENHYIIARVNIMCGGLSRFCPIDGSDQFWFELRDDRIKPLSENELVLELLEA